MDVHCLIVQPVSVLASLLILAKYYCMLSVLNTGMLQKCCVSFCQYQFVIFLLTCKCYTSPTNMPYCCSTKGSLHKALTINFINLCTSESAACFLMSAGLLLCCRHPLAAAKSSTGSGRQAAAAIGNAKVRLSKAERTYLPRPYPHSSPHDARIPAEGRVAAETVPTCGDTALAHGADSQPARSVSASQTMH